MARPRGFTDACLCGSLVESIDEENGIIRGVKVLGRKSARGRLYSDQALRDGVRLYEGIRVNFDHPDERRLASVRGFFDQIGCLRNCRLADDGDAVVGDLHYLKSHPGTALLLESAKRFPQLLGLSHNADGDRRRGPDGIVIVESLTEVRGVDIVTRPATNAGLFESHGEPDEDAEIMADPKKPTTKKTTLRALLESAPAGTPCRDRLARLLEADAAMGDMAAEVPAEPTAKSPEEAIRDSMTDAAIVVVRDMFSGKLDPKEGLKKLQDLLGMADQAAPADAGGDGKAATESVAEKRLNEQERRIALVECENMLLRSGREAKRPWIEALAAVPQTSRSALLESFPTPAQKPATKPATRPSTSPPLVESDGEGEPSEPAKDVKEFMARINRG